MTTDCTSVFIQPHATDNFPCNSEPVNPMGMSVESKVQYDGVNVAACAVALSDVHASVSDVFHAKELRCKVRLQQSTFTFFTNLCNACAPREQIEPIFTQTYQNKGQEI